MALNIPTTTADDISFGPGRIFVGAAGSTPSTDLGAIGEDGITLTISAEQKTIFQGNPKTAVLTFTQQQQVMLKATGIEWNYTNLVNALGGGVIATTGTYERFSFGGDPCPDESALHVQHQMCRTGDTLNIYCWRAVGSGNLEVALGMDEHQFPYEWNVLQSTTDWAGNSLASDQQLFRIHREI